MDQERFDHLTRAFATATSRRGILKGLIGTATGGLLASRGASAMAADRGARCTSDGDCGECLACQPLEGRDYGRCQPAADGAVCGGGNCASCQSGRCLADDGFCKQCQRCDRHSLTCQTNCPNGETCCDDGTCNTPDQCCGEDEKCNGTCCPSGQTCCNDGCCDGQCDGAGNCCGGPHVVCGGGVCCPDPLYFCCEGVCCNHRCDNTGACCGSLDEPLRLCDNGNCCPPGQICDIDHCCPADQYCDNQCCAGPCDVDGHCCQEGATICQGLCCAPDKFCCKDICCDHPCDEDNICGCTRDQTPCGQEKCCAAEEPICCGGNCFALCDNNCNHNPTTCACDTPPGGFAYCTQSDTCVDNTCPEGQFFDLSSCQCACPNNGTVCFDTCCPDGQECCADGSCQPQGQCCDLGTVCGDNCCTFEAPICCSGTCYDLCDNNCNHNPTTCACDTPPGGLAYCAKDDACVDNSCDEGEHFDLESCQCVCDSGVDCNGSCCATNEQCCEDIFCCAQDGSCCGNNCCTPDQQCCGDLTCCNAGETCMSNGLCCPQALCGGVCCGTDQKCCESADPQGHTCCPGDAFCCPDRFGSFACGAQPCT